MSRVKRHLLKVTRKKKLFRRVRGFFMARKNLRQATEAALKADAQAFIGRKQRKRQFRNLWTMRINAAVRLQGMSYSRFIFALKKANISLNRKMLAELCVREPAVFASVVKKAQAAVSS